MSWRLSRGGGGFGATTAVVDFRPIDVFVESWVGEVLTAVEGEVGGVVRVRVREDAVDGGEKEE